MQLMSNKEIKAMVGTEFIYVFNDRSEIPALVAAFDPEKAFTCLATSLIASDSADYSEDMDENGNLCISGWDKDNIDNFRVELSRILRSIKHLGYWRADSEMGFGYDDLLHTPNPTCNF